MLRCMQVVATRGEGGLERHYADLCNALARLDVEVIALADPTFADRLHHPVQFLPMDMTGSRWSPTQLWRLAKHIRKLKPDILHTHATKATAMVGSIAPLLPSACRRVATIHNWKRNLRPYRKAERIIAVSQRVADMLPADRTRVVHNGRPFEPTEPNRPWLAQEANLDEHLPILCTAGRLVTAKGFDLLLEAIAQGVHAQLVIAGDGPERPALQRQVQRLNLQQRVRLLGHRDDVLRIIASSDLGVIPSRHEGFCYVVVEMLQQQLPLVATDVADVATFIGPQNVAAVGDVDQLRHKLATALADLPTYRAGFTQAFNMARQELSVQGMAANTRRVYNELIR